VSADWQPQLFGLSRRCNVSEIRERSTTFTYAREREELITPMGFRHAAALKHRHKAKARSEGYCDDATAVQ